MRICPRCRTQKPESDFYPSKPTRACKACQNEQGRAWYRANSERRRQTAREWREKNPERWLALKRRHNATPDAKLKATLARYRRLYGLTPDQAAHLLTIKPEVCPACLRDVRLELDHCHESGRIRGWLCHLCNLAVGAARDDPETLERAAAYLRQPEIFLVDLEASA